MAAMLMVKKTDPIHIICQACASGKTHILLSSATTIHHKSKYFGEVPFEEVLGADPYSDKVLIAVPDATLANIYVEKLERVYGCIANNEGKGGGVQVVTHEKFLTILKTLEKEETQEFVRDAAVFIDEGDQLLKQLTATTIGLGCLKQFTRSIILLSDTFTKRQRLAL